MASQGVETRSLWQRICELAFKTLSSVTPSISSLVQQFCVRRYCVHELFGFDILLDSDLKPWLLEVNISPSLHTHSLLDNEVKTRVIVDMFNIAGFQVPSGKEARRRTSATAFPMEERENDVCQANVTNKCPILPPSAVATSCETCTHNISSPLGPAACRDKHQKSLAVPDIQNSFEVTSHSNYGVSSASAVSTNTKSLKPFHSPQVIERRGSLGSCAGCLATWVSNTGRTALLEPVGVKKSGVSSKLHSQSVRDPQYQYTLL
ncbi:unnamed protein product [Protopolystoma xenopodis]|uniref:Uncharacterized protein n=1 Tax=Protopolystoma xenopodis TaxID=117903 RepID=A0A3S5CHM3_9PLAT|nr:unnamed protein product [Protopolystoma xenopodis]